jgi:hypothetical protein
MSRTKVKEYKIPEFGDWFGCLACPEVSGLTRSHFIEHLKTVHKLESPIKGTRTLELHLDCEGYYFSQYSWTFGEIKASEDLIGPRGRC